MAWALATAGNNSVRNIASGKASSMKRLVVNLCRKDIMRFIQSMRITLPRTQGL